LGALKNTAILFVSSFAVQLGIAVLGTYWIHNVSAPVKVLLVVPYAAGVVAPAFSIYVFFSSALGPLDALNVGVLGTKAGATIVIALLDSWQWTGILLLACFFKLEQVPESHFEQARLEGVSRYGAWRRIVWPAINGVVLLFFLIRALDWFRKVDTVKALFDQGGPGYAAETVGMYIARNYFFADDQSFAAFLVLLQLVLLGLMLSLVFRFWLTRWLGDEQ
jgi:ABC-type sugar transport system permease subunit